MKEVREQQQQQGLYRSEFEHDNCGIGAVVNIKGKKTHDTVANALKIVEHLEHRAGKDAEGKTGDGVGILLQISHKFFKKACKKEGFEIGDEREYGIAQFFFRSTRSNAHRQRRCLRSFLRKKAWNFLDGVRSRYSRKCLDTRQENVCHVLCRYLSKSRKMWKKVFHLTVCSTLQDVSLNRVMIILM